MHTVVQNESLWVSCKNGTMILLIDIERICVLKQKTLSWTVTRAHQIIISFSQLLQHHERVKASEMITYILKACADASFWSPTDRFIIKRSLYVTRRDGCTLIYSVVSTSCIGSAGRLKDDRPNETQGNPKGSSASSWKASDVIPIIDFVMW